MHATSMHMSMEALPSPDAAPSPRHPLLVGQGEQGGFGEQHVIQLSIVLVSIVKEASKITELVNV